MQQSSIHCEAYGALLCTNVHWPGLRTAAAHANPLTIDVERVPQLAPSQPLLNRCQLQGRTLSVLGVAPDILMQVDDCLLVSFHREQRKLHCLATPRADDKVIEYWLLRQIVPIARLIWGEAEILHAGAVRIGSEAAAFLAPSCTGKSTLVAHFVERGHTLITDDHLVIQRHHGTRSEPTLVFPTIPYYRNYRALESLGRHTESYDPAPCRLRVIYVLKRAEPDAPVSISPLSNSDAALELLHQAPYTLMNRMLPDVLALFRRRFEFISNLPLNVHVRRLDVPRSLDRLAEVQAHIATDFHGLERSPHAAL